MPWSVSSHATPSYTTSKRLRWSKLIKAKITAASVASASTTAPRLTRRFCLISSTGQGYTLPQETRCNPKSIVWKMLIRETLLYSIAYYGGGPGLPRIILFLEGQIQLSRTRLFLKLNAEPTSKCPERWYQNNSAIPAVGGDVTLRQEVVAICDGLPPSQGKLWQRLADHQV